MARRMIRADVNGVRLRNATDEIDGYREGSIKFHPTIKVCVYAKQPYTTIFHNCSNSYFTN